ncbi:MAG: Crp/Fnr family transcriptional regulator [Rhodospirillales bacterium]|nr:Crp/Fnr family transcriptional regulator [Rhodospirillales bacterium]
MKELEKPVGLAPCIDNKIRKNTVWATLTKEEVDLFNRKVICREYTPGDMIFMEGDDCKGLYFVESGLVGVRKIDVDGNATLVRLANKGDTLGYRPFLARQSHRASADVIEDARVCFINAKTVRKVLHKNHELGLQFLERTARVLGDVEERLYEMSALNVDTRFVHLLILYHDQWGRHMEDGSVNITLPLTRDDLASMIGAHPDSVTRAIRNLETKGIVQVDGRLIHIQDFEELADHLHTELVHYH